MKVISGFLFGSKCSNQPTRYAKVQMVYVERAVLCCGHFINGNMQHNGKLVVPNRILKVSFSSTSSTSFKIQISSKSQASVLLCTKTYGESHSTFLMKYSKFPIQCISGTSLLLGWRTKPLHLRKVSKYLHCGLKVLCFMTLVSNFPLIRGAV